MTSQQNEMEREFAEFKVEYATPGANLDIDIGEVYYWACKWHEQYQAARAPLLAEVAELQQEVDMARQAEREADAEVEKIMRLAKEFVESRDIHEPIADNGMTVADGYHEAFRATLTQTSLKPTLNNSVCIKQDGVSLQTSTKGESTTPDVQKLVEAAKAVRLLLLMASPYLVAALLQLAVDTRTGEGMFRKIDALKEQWSLLDAAIAPFMSGREER